jgi:disulfide bond formation protein DsbB
MKNCRICTIIRYFLVAVVFIIILALTVNDKLHYLSFVTSWNAAILILFFGLLLFLYKVYEYMKSKN